MKAGKILLVFLRFGGLVVAGATFLTGFLLSLGLWAVALRVLPLNTASWYWIPLVLLGSYGVGLAPTIIVLGDLEKIERSLIRRYSL